MSEIDPWKLREERRMRARRDALDMTDDRRRELLAKESRPVASTGMMDAVSLPIYAEFGPAPFMESPNNDWLFPVGSGRSRGSNDGSLPRQLAVGGWIYLRADERLVARARFLGVERREVRVEHIPSEGGEFEDAGPGYVLVVDPASWKELDIPLADPVTETGNGYRYYRIGPDGVPVFTRAVT